MNTRTFSVLMILVASPCVAAEVSNKQLLEDCGKKTIVIGRDGSELVPAGEELSGYCSGYLQASFSALKNEANCSAQERDSSFLLSVYMQYLEDKNTHESVNASKTLSQAFRRILECK